MRGDDFRCNTKYYKVGNLIGDFVLLLNNFKHEELFSPNIYYNDYVTEEKVSQII